MSSRAAVAGILVLCLTPVTALTLSKDSKKQDPKVAGFGRILDAGGVPVLHVDEAGNFFEAMHNQAVAKEIEASKTHIEGAKATCTPTKALILVFGLMRSYQRTWPIVADHLNLNKIGDCGGYADVVVNTDLMTRCSSKEFADGRCRPEWQTGTDVEYLAQIQETYKPYLKVVFNSTARNTYRIVESMEGTPASAHYSADTGFLESMFGGLKKDMHLNRYTHMVVLRADTHFSQALPNLHEMCAQFPGLNTVHGDYETNCFVHSRDCDKAWVACTPSLMRDAYDFETQNKNHQCVESELPPIPEGFGGQWYGTNCPMGNPAESQECRAIKYFSDRQIRWGTLDALGTFTHVVQGNEY